METQKLKDNYEDNLLNIKNELQGIFDKVHADGLKKDLHDLINEISVNQNKIKSSDLQTYLLNLDKKIDKVVLAFEKNVEEKNKHEILESLRQIDSQIESIKNNLKNQLSNLKNDVISQKTLSEENVIEIANMGREKLVIDFKKEINSMDNGFLGKIIKFLAKKAS